MGRRCTVECARPMHNRQEATHPSTRHTIAGRERPRPNKAARRDEEPGNRHQRERYLIAQAAQRRNNEAATSHERRTLRLQSFDRLFWYSMPPFFAFSRSDRAHNAVGGELPRSPFPIRLDAPRGHRTIADLAVLSTHRNINYYRFLPFLLLPAADRRSFF